MYAWPTLMDDCNVLSRLHSRESARGARGWQTDHTQFTHEIKKSGWQHASFKNRSNVIRTAPRQSLGRRARRPRAHETRQSVHARIFPRARSKKLRTVCDYFLFDCLKCAHVAGAGAGASPQSKSVWSSGILATKRSNSTSESTQ